MALYTYAQLYTEVRDILRDPAPGTLVTDTNLRAWADRGARNISAVTLCWPTTATSMGHLVQTETVTTVESTYRYSLTAQFIKVFSVIFEPIATTPYGLERMDIRDLGHGYCNGVTGAAVVPVYYYHFANSLYIWPSPIGAANVGTKIKVYGAVSCEDYMHNDMTDIYGIPDRLQDALLDYMLACSYMKMGKFFKAGFHMQNYLAQLEFERRDNFDHKHMPESKDMYELPTTTVAAQ